MNTFRTVKRVVTGQPAVDGAGVKLQRVLGLATVEDFDPFLMLDSFDSQNPADYTRGFPMHPHRGIETITYLVEGLISHEDSLGNKGDILPGESQWMTAGSGIMHQEMPQAAPRMLGFQLWLNLPADQKMTAPKYFDIKNADIAEVQEPHQQVRVLSGEYKGARGATPHHIQARILDVQLQDAQTSTIPVDPNHTAFVFLLQGSAQIDGHTYPEKSAILLENGDAIQLASLPDEPLRFQVISAPSLHESVAWGGPIVMNTREELSQAFADLRSGDFIKQEASW